MVDSMSQMTSAAELAGADHMLRYWGAYKRKDNANTGFNTPSISKDTVPGQSLEECPESYSQGFTDEEMNRVGKIIANLGGYTVTIKLHYRDGKRQRNKNAALRAFSAHWSDLPPLT